jgi:hypothetical protein
MSSFADFVNIITLGKLYYPASSHYNDCERITCDRCNNTNLLICIGYKDRDLCLRCAEEVADKNLFYDVLPRKISEPEILSNPLKIIPPKPLIPPFDLPDKNPFKDDLE